MKIAAFQFGSTENIDHNFDAIKRATKEAFQNKVRLLVFHECALSGYPPLETPDINRIDFDKLSAYTLEIQHLAKKYNMYIVLGTIIKTDNQYYNSTLLIDPHGEIIGRYDKKALWGYDIDNFAEGKLPGIYEIDGIKVGFRICYEIRFPEYFRELLQSKVELCIVTFSDTSKEDLTSRYETIKAHLLTRAVENVMTIVSVNSISKFQTAPTAVFDINGNILKEAPKNEEFLLIYDYHTPEIRYMEKGRIQHSLELLNH